MKDKELWELIKRLCEANNTRKLEYAAVSLLAQQYKDNSESAKELLRIMIK